MQEFLGDNTGSFIYYFCTINNEWTLELPSKNFSNTTNGFPWIVISNFNVLRIIDQGWLVKLLIMINYF